MSDIMQDTHRKGFLITGLPDDLALMCLARIPRVRHSSVSRVCKSWRELFRSEELFKLRASLMIKDPWLLVVKEFPPYESPPPKGFRPEHRFFSCFMYDLSSKKRCDLPPLTLDSKVSEKFHFAGYKCAAIGPEFVVLGGVRSRVYGQPRMNIFDTVTRTWYKGSDMQVARYCFSCGLIGGKLYVAGGYNETGQVDLTGEVYDPQTKQWSMIAPMPYGLANIESDVVFKDRLYIKGRIPFGRSDEQKVVCYDPVTNSWETLRNMENGLTDGQFVPTDEHLFIFNSLHYVGRYNEETARWDQVGNISCYYFPFECPAQRNIGFGKEVFFLNSTAGECLNLHIYDMVHLVLAKIFWGWHGAIVAV